jgi:YbbR domain-containing protein
MSYKLVSLFIAAVLWVTILGRRDFTLTKNIEVELFASQGLVVNSVSADTVKIKVSGPRNAIKKFIDSGLNQVITIDVTKYGEGNIEVEIPVHKIDVPFGVKIVSIRPSFIHARVTATKK